MLCLLSTVAATTTGCPFFGDSGDGRGGRCAGAGANEPLLLGLDDSTTKALLRVANKNLVVVNAERSGCTLRLTLLDDCVANGRYTYQPNQGDTTLLFKDVDELERSLPHAGTDFQQALALFGGMKVQVLRAGRMVAPEEVILDRRALRGQTCAAATHIVKTIALGAYGAAAVEPDRLTEFGDLFEVSPLLSHMTVDKRGRRAACEMAAETEQPTRGCATPVRVELVPLVSQRGGARSISVAAGRFERGFGGPRSHDVTLSAYRIDATEVSVADYETCVQARRCSPAGSGRMCNARVRGRATHPINCVTWTQARDYCRFVGKRLPTEAEWERAALVGHQGPFPWGAAWPPPNGSVNLADVAARRTHPEWRSLSKYLDGFAETAPVGVLGGRDDGARDLAGNVMEWTADYFAPYDTRSQRNPKGPRRGITRVVRGSSFGQSKREDLLVIRRHGYRPDMRSAHIGFRCAN